ncbi:MAG: SDR family oxidoreductase [Deferribacterales bacterium]
MKILITGSTGYIGHRLAHRLAGKGTLVRLFVRNRFKTDNILRSKCEIYEGDTFNPGSLDKALEGIHTAYYLIHSMGKTGGFEQTDIASAKNFRDACIRNGVKKIIYLGGLGVKNSASRHLLSRIETGETLSAQPEKIDVIWFRAGVIIGSGSASFEIIRNISQKLPVMITPKWVKTLTEPIGVDDVISYLAKAADESITGSRIIDIGSEVMSFREMMKQAADVMGLKRYIIPTPFLTPSLSSYWLILFTPVTYSIASALIEGLSSETVKTNNSAAELFPDITPLSYRDSFRMALKEIEDHQVISSWCDSSGGRQCDVPLVHDISIAVYKDRYIRDTGGKTPEEVFSAVKSLGGRNGWGTYNLLWRVRGLIDKLSGGYGLNRGRRDSADLRVGDTLDFWKVADLADGRRLLLQAQMKVPGRAWLEFQVIDTHLIMTAFFYPHGISGRLYWYAMLPFHKVIFPAVIREILSQTDFKTE